MNFREGNEHARQAGAGSSESFASADWHRHCSRVALLTAEMREAMATDDDVLAVGRGMWFNRATVLVQHESGKGYAAADSEWSEIIADLTRLAAQAA